MARARESALRQCNVGAAFVRRKGWAQDPAIFSKIEKRRPLPHSLLAFFVRFVSNDQAMDPKIILTILPLVSVNFGSVPNLVNNLQLPKIVRDLPSP